MNIASQGVKLLCYDVKNINKKSKNVKKKKFEIHQGYRFDSENHHWLFLSDYISLSYSYMTFVIKKKFDDDQDLQKIDYLFDKEQYNYIINKRTPFIDEDEYVKEHEKLLFILTSFERIDPLLLEQIQYYTYDEEGEIVSPLHTAFKAKNSRSVKILLTYMANIDYNASKVFKDILPELIEYNGFIKYL